MSEKSVLSNLVSGYSTLMKISQQRQARPFMLVTKEFVFDAAHNLVNYHGTCERLHGHTWRLQVTVRAPVGEDGLAFDFVELKKRVNEKIISRLDHVYLNDILPQSSAENLAIWIWQELKELPLYEIKVWETPTSLVTYCGPGKTEGRGTKDER